jgi:hypothetical protein
MHAASFGFRVFFLKVFYAVIWKPGSDRVVTAVTAGDRERKKKSEPVNYAYIYII